MSENLRSRYRSSRNSPNRHPPYSPHPAHPSNTEKKWAAVTALVLGIISPTGIFVIGSFLTDHYL